MTYSASSDRQIRPGFGFARFELDDGERVIRDFPALAGRSGRIYVTDRRLIWVPWPSGEAGFMWKAIALITCFSKNKIKVISRDEILGVETPTGKSGSSVTLQLRGYRWMYIDPRSSWAAAELIDALPYLSFLIRGSRRWPEFADAVGQLLKPAA